MAAVDPKKVARVDRILSINRGCMGAIDFAEQATRAGVDRQTLGKLFKTKELNNGIAAGIRYVYRKSFNFSAYKLFLEGNSWRDYYKQRDLDLKDLERL